MKELYQLFWEILWTLFAICLAIYALVVIFAHFAGAIFWIFTS